MSNKYVKSTANFLLIIDLEMIAVVILLLFSFSLFNSETFTTAIIILYSNLPEQIWAQLAKLL